MPLHPQAQSFLDAVAEQNPPGWEELTPQQGREIFDSFGDLFGQGPELNRVEDRTLPGGVRIRFYRDSDEHACPVVVYFHGGGWVLGNRLTHDAVCRRLAKASGCAVVSVDYALSPEHPFPKPLEDCYAATNYVAQHGDEFGVDTDRLAVAGDSAGGNLAAAVALRSRDEDGPSIQMQVLIYPVIEPNFDTNSYSQFAEGFGLTRAGMKWFWQQYLGSQDAPPQAAPAKANSLKRLPATHVITAEYDVLRDEGESFAQRLTESGVPTTHKRYDGNLHGFVHFAGIFDDGIAATNDIAQILKKALVRPD